MLYLVATPIGNLSDITFRAIETLTHCDYILCEDTRYSARLLNHYAIKTPSKSFHKFNEIAKEESIINELKSGKKIALISDAGTPGISDPGQTLVKHCVEKQILVTAIPGPCAAITGLSCSGFSSNRFQFYGFLPKKQGELKSALLDILDYTGTTICYESPKRIVSVLSCIKDLSPLRSLAIARELTKIHEEVLKGNADTLIQKLQTGIKGEIVLLIEGKSDLEAIDWENLPQQEHVALMEKTYKLTRQEAIKMVARMRGISKREVYKEVHNNTEKILSFT